MKSQAALVIVTVVVTAIVTSLLWVVGVAVVYWQFSASQPPYMVAVEAPEVVEPGATFGLRLQVRNPTDGQLELGSIDIYDSLLDGFRLAAVEPAPTHREHTLNFTSLYYNHTLDPGAAFVVDCQLEAVRGGVWTGDVDFCTPSENFVTSTVTIRVGN